MQPVLHSPYFSSMKSKTVKTVTSHEQTTEGSGYKIRRITNNVDLATFDPIILLDYFSSKYPSGFYDHPHRGFQMATYITKGELVHEDFKGNKNILKEGEYSWANIGRGVVHSEMPGSISKETEGFLLWINLPRENKLDKYSYRKFDNREVQVVEKQGITIKVLVGEAFGVKSPITAKSEVVILDVTMQDECVFEHIIPKAWNSLCYVYQGEIDILANCGCCDTSKVLDNQSALMQISKEDRVLHIETGKVPARFLLIAGKPLGEPIHQHGPFVMATQQELDKALEDYKYNENGFEGSHEFESRFGSKKRKTHDRSPVRILNSES